MASVYGVSGFGTGRRDDGGLVAVITRNSVWSGSHGIGGVELRCRVLGISLVGLEIILRAEEVSVSESRHAEIPRGVEIVVYAAQLYDVPRVAFSLGYAADNAAVHAQLKAKTVKQGGKALTHGGIVYHSGVCCVDELVVSRRKTGVVVFHIFADIVVNCADLGVIVGVFDVKVLNESRYCLVQLTLHFGGSVPVEGVGELHVINAAYDTRFTGYSRSAEVRQQVVALLRVPRVLEAVPKKLLIIKILADFASEAYGNTGLSVDHGASEVFNTLVQGSKAGRLRVIANVAVSARITDVGRIALRRDSGRGYGRYVGVLGTLCANAYAHYDAEHDYASQHS